MGLGKAYDAAARFIARPGESFVAVRLRLAVLLFMLATAAGATGGLIGAGNPFYANASSWGCLVALALTCLIGMPLLLLTRVDPVAVVTVLVPPAVLCVLAVDWYTAAQMVGTRGWAMNVLVLDLLLVVNASQKLQVLVIAMVLVWLAVENAEAVWRFGLYEGATLEENSYPQSCSCSHPPCQQEFWAALGSRFGVVLFILLTDYHLTRWFSTGLRRQLEHVAAAERVSELVAELLAEYSTYDARRVVAAEGAALPEALRASYERLLDNLDSYRAFLPDSLLYHVPSPDPGQQQHELAELLEDLDGCEQSQGATEMAVRHISARPAPGVNSAEPEVAMCFTDIQSSTALWEAHPQGMYDGLNLHNSVMRAAYAACNGYEVKTIGDSFMVAFDAAVDALRFGLEAQLGLLRQDWPWDLLKHPLCIPIRGGAGELLWCGLRVRIGVAYGPVRVDRNPVTMRNDYFGHTVNVAARLEAILKKGGLVATSQSAAAALTPEQLRQLGSPVVHDAGRRTLKGVAETVHVWALVPLPIKGRLAVLDESQPLAVLPPSVGVPEIRTHPISPASIPSPCSPDMPAPAGSVQALPPPPLKPSASFGTGLRSAPSFRSTRSGQASPRSAGTPSGDPTRLSFNNYDHLAAAPVQTPRQRRQHRRMQHSSCTCATVRAALREAAVVTETVTQFAASVALAADRTQGVVDSVLSASVVVTWNASRPCLDHTAAARSFSMAKFRVPHHLGAASGGVLFGSVAAGRRSFATVVGGSVELSAALAEEAERCGDPALVCGAAAVQFLSAGEAFCAQLWHYPGGSVTVYELGDLDRQDTDDKWLFHTEPHTPQDADDSPVSVLFRKACAGGPGSEAQEECLEALQSLSGGGAEWGPAAANLAHRIARGVVRSRPMPMLWEPGVVLAGGGEHTSSTPRHPPGGFRFGRSLGIAAMAVDSSLVSLPSSPKESGSMMPENSSL